MGQPKNTIELNGRVYDVSGDVMVDAETAVPVKKVVPISSSGGSMDGFFKPGKVDTNVTPVVPVASTKTSQKSRKHSVNHAKRQPEHSKTLMRHVVHKPKPNPPAVEAKSKTTKAQVTPPGHVQHDRLQRASHIAKSSSVSRFGSPASAVNKRVEPLAVKSHPEEQAEADEPAAAQTVAPPIGHLATSTTSQASFDKALQNADSHQQPKPKKAHIHHRAAKKLGVSTRALSLASVSLVVAILIGFIAYQNAANISMQMASAQAGFQGGLPHYTPGGFGLSSPIKSSPGVITLSFHSHSDPNRSYTVTQRPSDWTSDTLKSNFFTGQDKPVAVDDKGKTIYFYNNGNSAVWVNAGLMYQVDSKASLTNDQLVSIADSL